MPVSGHVAVASLLLLPLLPVHASPLSSCYGNSTTLDWYIDAVGETPCMTYQKLRQLCNSNYQTPSWAIEAPTDQCDDPISICCCNSIAFSIRMLCINCQWDAFGTTDPGHSASTSIDSFKCGGTALTGWRWIAVPGSFYVYRWSSGVVDYCGDGWNQTLPDIVQLAVCQKGIRLEDFLYSIFWPDGSCAALTFYHSPDFEQQAQQLLVSQPQSPSYCTNTTQIATSTASFAHTMSLGDSSIPPAANTSAGSVPPVVEKTNSPTAIGALGGALGLVVIGAIVAILLYRRSLRRRYAVLVAGIQERPNTHEGVPASGVTPFFKSFQDVAQIQSEHTRKRTPPPSQSHSAPSVFGYGREAYESPVPVSAALSTYGMPSSELSIRDRDAGRVPVSLPQLPPDYRTVYSID
ncbi:hypothetical protein C8Q72DRAFT_791619 [Fomitopsis betulina]|nr:hypothetical protein C8Q72DRAFT_791619 [Fomitopsis betulina]